MVIEMSKMAYFLYLLLMAPESQAQFGHSSSERSYLTLLENAIYY